MKLFHDKHTMSLNQLSLMFETNDIGLIRRFRWVPVRLCRRPFERFMIEFSELFNRNEVNDLMSDDFLRFRIITMASLSLPTLYRGLVMTDDPRFRAKYRERFGRDYTNLDDLKLILNEIGRLQGKLKEMGTPEKVIEEKGKMSFEEIVTYVELMLEKPIDRTLKLYQFKSQYDAAIRRARAMEKVRAKNG